MKKYQCSCGNTFSRRDVLSRHIRSCSRGQETIGRHQRRDSNSLRQTRSKTACNRCARAKLKCDSQHPCERCKARLVACEYSRNGYSDPYQVFSIQPTLARSPSAISLTSSSAQPTLRELQHYQDDPFKKQGGPHADAGMAFLSSTPAPTDLERPTRGVMGDTILDGPGQPLESANGEVDGIPSGTTGIFVDPLPAWYGFEEFDLSLAAPEWENLFTALEGHASNNISNLVPNKPGELSAQLTKRAITEGSTGRSNYGLQLHQIDSVEGKCVEIRDYLQSFQTGLDCNTICKHIYRNRLVQCIQLYADKYETLQPFVHLPTFNLASTSPILLVAMMLIGAAYSHESIPSPVIIHCAIHVLLLIEASSHERTMAIPPISTIQAHTLLCRILLFTKDANAYRFAIVHKARTRSMAERAGIFNAAAGPVDYQSLDLSSFDWYSWIEVETRQRLAYQVFIDDIGTSIFTRVPSHISPFTCFADMPSYNAPWIASTQDDCLRMLQNMPPQLPLARAMKMVRSASDGDSHLFEASDPGMLQVVLGLHELCFRTMEQSLDHENILPQDVRDQFPSLQIPSLSDVFHCHLANQEIAEIADDLIARYGSSSIQHVNNALNAWRRNWDARGVQDVLKDGDSLVFTHPLSFWLLLKLFIVLHFFRNHDPKNSSRTGGGQNLQAGECHMELGKFLRANGESASGRLAVQEQVIKWLSRIRRLADDEPLPTHSYLSHVLST